MTVKSIGHRLILLIVALGITFPAAAQRVDGQVYSQVYGLENRAADQQWDFYQGLSLRLRPNVSNGFSFKTHFRFARRGDPADWDEKIYNAYLDYRDPASQFAVRAGRQFIYRGVIHGSMDAVSFEAYPRPEVTLQAVAGLATPYDRSLDLQSWDEAGVLGLYGQYRISPMARASLSYFSRHRDGGLARQQVGAAVNGKFEAPLYYQAQLEYNLLAQDIQAMRYRLSYILAKWTLMGEFVNQKPRVLEDSFFNIFELEAFNQIRTGASYRMQDYEVGLQFVQTMFAEDETGSEIFGTVSHRIGSVGVVYKTGFGGDNFGIFGDVSFALMDNLSARLRSSYYSYTRRSVAFDEDATAFSGGVDYRPVPAVRLQLELQESMNSAYDDNLRVLLRASYRLGK